jgi:hypothetical protein
MGQRKLTLTVWEAMMKMKAAVPENIEVSRVRLSGGVPKTCVEGLCRRVSGISGLLARTSTMRRARVERTFRQTTHNEKMSEGREGESERVNKRVTMGRRMFDDDA